MGQVLLKDVGLDLEHVEREACILGVLIAGLRPQVLKVVHLVRVVLGGHVLYLKLFLRFRQVLESFLGILDPTIFDD